MARPITTFAFAMQWDEIEGCWYGEALHRENGKTLGVHGETLEKTFCEILTIARYTAILEEGATGIISAEVMAAQCEGLLRYCGQYESWLSSLEPEAIA